MFTQTEKNWIGNTMMWIAFGLCLTGNSIMAILTAFSSVVFTIGSHSLRSLNKHRIWIAIESILLATLISASGLVEVYSTLPLLVVLNVLYAESVAGSSRRSLNELVSMQVQVLLILVILSIVLPTWVWKDVLWVAPINTTGFIVLLLCIQFPLLVANFRKRMVPRRSLTIQKTVARDHNSRIHGLNHSINVLK